MSTSRIEVNAPYSLYQLVTDRELRYSIKVQIEALPLSPFQQSQYVHSVITDKEAEKLIPEPHSEDNTPPLSQKNKHTLQLLTEYQISLYTICTNDSLAKSIYEAISESPNTAKTYNIKLLDLTPQNIHDLYIRNHQTLMQEAASSEHQLEVYQPLKSLLLYDPSSTNPKILYSILTKLTAILSNPQVTIKYKSLLYPYHAALQQNVDVMLELVNDKCAKLQPFSEEESRADRNRKIIALKAALSKNSQNATLEMQQKAASENNQIVKTNIDILRKAAQVKKAAYSKELLQLESYVKFLSNLKSSTVTISDSTSQEQRHALPKELEDTYTTFTKATGKLKAQEVSKLEKQKPEQILAQYYSNLLLEQGLNAKSIKIFLDLMFNFNVIDGEDEGEYETATNAAFLYAIQSDIKTRFFKIIATNHFEMFKKLFLQFPTEMLRSIVDKHDEYKVLSSLLQDANNRDIFKFLAENGDIDLLISLNNTIFNHHEKSEAFHTNCDLSRIILARAKEHNKFGDLQFIAKHCLNLIVNGDAELAITYLKASNQLANLFLEEIHCNGKYTSVKKYILDHADILELFRSNLDIKDFESYFKVEPVKPVLRHSVSSCSLEDAKENYQGHNIPWIDALKGFYPTDPLNEFEVWEHIIGDTNPPQRISSYPPEEQT